MKSPLWNARNTPLTQKSGMLPQLHGAMANYFQPMTFIKVQKAISGGMVVESGDAGEPWTSPSGQTIQGIQVNFDGFMVPGVKKMDIKGTGEQAWLGYDLYTTPQLQLQQDDAVVDAEGVQYRVLLLWPFKNFGFMHYFLNEDYRFSGPLQQVTDGVDQSGAPVPVTDPTGKPVIE